jgi:CubicO group peptidase (beta-lactamase class C family)
MRLLNHARVVPGFAALLVLAACAATVPQPRLGELARSHELLQVLAGYSPDVNGPAWAAAVVKGDKVVAVAGIGLHDVQTGTSLVVDRDLFHWGSVTESVTATMISGLIQDGTLSWRATLAELLPDAQMREEYRGFTLASLLDPPAKLPPYTNFETGEPRRFSRYTGTSFDKRDAFVREVLQQAPPLRSDTGLAYPHAGPAIAAHLAEVAAGQSWEELVKKHVFDPVGMSSADFGFPENQILDPAGNIRSTVHDMALYARAHLLGLRGRQGPLNSLGVRDVHAGDQVVHWNNGSAGQSFAEIDIYPDDDLAIVIMTNAELPGSGTEDLVRRIRRLYVGD